MIRRLITEKQKEQVSEMFNNIAPSYDSLNRFLSGGIDKRWRRRLADSLRPHNPKTILDVATGTADVAIMLAQLRPDKITGIDISAGMLEIAMKKISRLNLLNMIELKQADAAKLPFNNDSFDAVAVAFGVRNFENLHLGLSEIHRVMRPGGKLGILEFSIPKNRMIRWIFLIYLRNLLPLIGKTWSKNATAYNYLSETIQEFPYGCQFVSKLQNAGFSNANAEPLSMGIVTLYTALK